MREKNEVKMHETDHARLNRAIHFAVDRHAGQVRKGNGYPYILHPLETLQILVSMKADINLQIAGVLHDTIEDTETTAEEIMELFGGAIGELVNAHSEDKSRSWDERKALGIEQLKKSSFRLKMMIMADKVSNLRSLVADQEELGEELWERFNAPKEKQAWYYSKIQDALHDMQEYSRTAKVYWEMVGLFKDIFVTYYLDEENVRLYQVSTDKEGFFLDRGSSRWRELDRGSTANAISISIPISRKEAEELEDRWNEEI